MNPTYRQIVEYAEENCPSFADALREIDGQLGDHMTAGMKLVQYREWLVNQVIEHQRLKWCMDVKSVTGGSGQPLANANSADAKSRSDD